MTNAPAPFPPLRPVLAMSLLACLPTLHAEPPAERPWREPGQIVSADYLAHGALRYSAAGGDIIGRNLSAFNNRPLYGGSPGDNLVLAGDRPFVRLIGRGAFAAAVLRHGKGGWWHDYAEVESHYRCGRMTWLLSDPAVPGMRLRLDAVALPDAEGFALRLRAEGLEAGDRLVWTLAGTGPSNREQWDPVMRGNPRILRTGDPRKPELSYGFMTAWSAGNRVRIDHGLVRLRAADDAAVELVGGADRDGFVFAADASGYSNPERLSSWPASLLPVGCGAIDLEAGAAEVHWAFATVPTGAAPGTATPKERFAAAWARQEAAERVAVETPDSHLDAALLASCHPVDASFHGTPPLFHHGQMSFNIPFLGWRIITGSTVLGWHDRVAANAAHYFGQQVREAPANTRPDPDPVRLGAQQSKQSRFFGRGKVVNPYDMYDTQSQFFDQTIREWRATADPELERGLRPALELHLEWARECFDPDGDGLYESYINTLPTDSVWYNGGSSVEQSTYIHTAHLAARDLARRAGDAAAAERHQREADKIRRALLDVLWLRDRGHFGLYVEQEAPHRVHPDAWSISQFLPIDAGLLDPEHAVQALHYTEWALERIRLPYGGSLRQLSNWAPAKWSVRDIFNGDVWALALAYAQTGLADEGWDLLRGAMLETAYAGGMPGGFSHIGAGADFADSTNMFPRAVIEGLFGYEPDYPNGRVFLRPALPTAWPSAALRTPDFGFRYRREGDAEHYQLNLTREAAVDFRLPVRAEHVRAVMLNGAPVAWKAEAGWGCTWIRLLTPSLRSAEVTIELAGRLEAIAPAESAGTVGQPVALPVPRGTVVRVDDLHGAVADLRFGGAAITGRWAARPGHHLVLAEVRVGELPQRLMFKCRIDDPAAEVRAATQTPRAAPASATWACLDLGPQLNGDVRTIFQQAYLSPRPATVSLRLGTDGWSAWTFTHWGDKPPAISLDNVPRLLDAQQRIRTPQGAPFTAPRGDRNIAFTSRWDNWPRQVGVPVGRSAEAAWLLVAGSTFPMHFRLPNAVVRFRYADGQEERLNLVPPLNFWSLCSWGGVDYDPEIDGPALPARPPPQVQLGQECRAMVLSWRLRPGVKLESVTLETLSPEVVIGLMGVSLMNPVP